PADTERYDAFLAGKGFDRAEIRELSDSDIQAFLAAYVGEKRASDLLEQQAKTGAQGFFRSPLLALMAIRIAATEAPSILTTFQLFERYVQVLHQYFNAPAVRGKDKLVAAPEILAALSASAHSIR